LDTKEIGKDGCLSNEVINFTIYDHNSGLIFTLVFHELPTYKSELESLLKKATPNENFDKAFLLRDLIKQE
jgi:hypothetical protein